MSRIQNSHTNTQQRRKIDRESIFYKEFVYYKYLEHHGISKALVATQPVYVAVPSVSAAQQSTIHIYIAYLQSIHVIAHFRINTKI